MTESQDSPRGYVVFFDSANQPGRSVSYVKAYSDQEAIRQVDARHGGPHGIANVIVEPYDADTWHNCLVRTFVHPAPTQPGSTST